VFDKNSERHGFGERNSVQDPFGFAEVCKLCHGFRD
jgi:hypothetical protein